MSEKRLLLRCTAFAVASLAFSADLIAAPRWQVHLPDAVRNPTMPLDLWKFGPLLLIFLLWITTIRRVDADSAHLSLNRAKWNTLLLPFFVLGFSVAVILPAYAVGLGVAMVTYAIPVVMYVVHRNKQVHRLDRVLTWSDLKRRLRGEMRVRQPVTKKSSPSPEAQRPDEDERVVFVGKSTSRIADDFRLTEYAKTSQGYQAAVDLIATAVEQEATDLHINPKANEVIARIRVEGNLKTLPPMDKTVGGNVVNIFKVLADLDIAVKKKSQDGSFRADIDGRRLNFRVSTQSTQVGEKMSIRILDPAQTLTKFHDLGMNAVMRARLRELLDRPHGLLLICGPTGAGKSTTAYAALRETDLEDRNVMSVEDPVETYMTQIDQIEVNNKIGLTFESALRSLLRQDPDMVLIGEIRDGESAKIACQAATTGMLVISTIHGTNPMSALQRMIDLGVEPYSVCAAVMAILGQRLVRKLCPACKQPYTPDDATLDKLGLQMDSPVTLYRSPPVDENECPECNGRGIHGKTGVFEYLEMSRELRKMVRGKVGETQFNIAATEQGMSTMRESALSLLTQGVISVEECLRILSE